MAKFGANSMNEKRGLHTQERAGLLRSGGRGLSQGDGEGPGSGAPAAGRMRETWRERGVGEDGRVEAML